MKRIYLLFIVIFITADLIAQRRKVNSLEIGIQLASVHLGEKYRTYNNRFQYGNALVAKYYSGQNCYRAKLMYNHTVTYYPSGINQQVFGTNRGYLAGLGYERGVNVFSIFMDVNYRLIRGEANITTGTPPLQAQVISRSHAIELQPGFKYQLDFKARYRLVAEVGWSLLWVNTDIHYINFPGSLSGKASEEDLVGSGFVRFLFLIDLHSFGSN